MTTPDGKPHCSNSFLMPSAKLEIVVNVLQFGLDREIIEDVVNNAAMAGFGNASNVNVEDLD